MSFLNNVAASVLEVCWRRPSVMHWTGGKPDHILDMHRTDSNCTGDYLLCMGGWLFEADLSAAGTCSVDFTVMWTDR